jgi:hypothetical protein
MPAALTESPSLLDKSCMYMEKDFLTMFTVYKACILIQMPWHPRAAGM